MSIPPAGLTMNTARLDARSTMTPAYASVAMSAAGVTSTLSHGEPLDLHAEDLRRDLPRLGRRLGELHAARLAAAARVHLRLHDHGAADTSARVASAWAGVVATSPGGTGMP